MVGTRSAYGGVFDNSQCRVPPKQPHVGYQGHDGASEYACGRACGNKWPNSFAVIHRRPDIAASPGGTVSAANPSATRVRCIGKPPFHCSLYDNVYLLYKGTFFAKGDEATFAKIDPPRTTTGADPPYCLPFLRPSSSETCPHYEYYYRRACVTSHLSAYSTRYTPHSLART